MTQMRRFILTIFAAAFALNPKALATTFIPMPFPELVKGVPTVVRGKIGTSYSDWVTSSDSAQRIYTFYRLQVQESFKGDVPVGDILIRELGGEKGGVGMQVAGAAQFSRGEDVVLFLGERNSDGSYDVRGLSSGKFNLRRQPNGAECLSGIGVTAAAGADGFLQDHENEGAQDASASRCDWTVEALRNLVREQGVTTKTIPSSSPVPAHSVVKIPPLQINSTTQPAPQLQSDARGQLWIVVLALGLIGLLVAKFLF
jgi:hypothetical protein